MTSIVKELRGNGGWAVIIRTIKEDNKSVYRAVVMSMSEQTVVPDSDNIEEVIFECECRLRDLSMAS